MRARVGASGLLLFALAGCATGGLSSRPSPSPTPAGHAASAVTSTPAAPQAPAWTRSEPPPSLEVVPRTTAHRETQLMPNGMRVIVIQQRARPLVGVRLILPTGAAADPAPLAGSTWFALQALAGTYDETNELGELANLSEKSARRLIGELGARLVVETEADYSVIGIDGFSKDTSTYLQRLYALVKEPRCGEATFNALVDSVTDEVNELELSDSAVLEEHLQRLAFGEGTAYARPTYGTPVSLSRLDIEDIRSRQKAVLAPLGSTLLVTGDVEPAVVFRAAQRTLGAWFPRAHPRPRSVVAGPPLGRRRYVTLLPRGGAPTTLVCAARRLSEKAASRAALEVVAHVLGARLDRNLRDEQGLTYGASATPLRQRGARALLACTRLGGAQTGAGLAAMLEQIKSLATTPPTEEEVATARAILAAGWEASGDGLADAVWHNVRGIGLGEEVLPHERAAEVRSVPLDEVQALARNVGNVAFLQIVTSGETRVVAQAVRELKLGKGARPGFSACGSTKTMNERGTLGLSPKSSPRPAAQSPPQLMLAH